MEQIQSCLKLKGQNIKPKTVLKKAKKMVPRNLRYLKYFIVIHIYTVANTFPYNSYII